VSLREDVTSLFVLRSAPGRILIALQAAIAIGLPTVGFALAGRADLGLLASSGAFTALFLVDRSRRARATYLPFVALGLIAAAALGAAAAGSVASSIVMLFIVTLAASALSLSLSLGPPGALFFILVAGVSSHLAAPSAIGGDGLSGLLIVGMIAIGAVLAYLVILAPLVVPSVRSRDFAVHADRVRMRFGFDHTTRVIFTRIAIAATAAAMLSAPLGIHRAYWVMVAAVVILQNGHRIKLTAIRAVHRVAGTILGVGLFALVMLWNPHDLVLALLLVVLQFAVEMVVVRNYGLALILITPLALTIASQGTTGDVGEVIVERVLDTLLGAGIALVVLAVAYLVGRRRPITA